jgi:hypothetical protein
VFLLSAIIVTATFLVELDTIDSAEIFCCEVVLLVNSFSSNFDVEMLCMESMWKPQSEFYKITSKCLE